MPSQLLAAAVFGAGAAAGLFAFLPPFWLVDGMYRTLAGRIGNAFRRRWRSSSRSLRCSRTWASAARGVQIARPAASPAPAHGGKSLTMCMGLGTALRRDGPHHRLAARAAHRDADEQPVTCNGRFPLLITLFDRVPFRRSHARLQAQDCFRVAGALSVCVTLRSSRLLSAAAARRRLRAFSLELPPYRRPRVGQVLVRSLLDRTVFVLGRAVTVAAPAGLLIYLLGNCTVGGTTLLAHGAAALDPLGRTLGLDGMILSRLSARLSGE